MHELKAFDLTFMKLATYSTDQTTLQDKINNLNSNHEKSVPMRVEFVRLKSYENTESAGEVFRSSVSARRSSSISRCIFNLIDFLYFANYFTNSSSKYRVRTSSS